MTTIVSVPRGLIRAASASWDIDWRGQSAGSATDASEQVVFNAFPRWRGMLELRLSHDLGRQWRAIRAAARGRVGVWRLPLVDLHVPVCADPGGIPFSTGETFSTGVGFAYRPFVTTLSAAAAGATEILVSETSAEVLVGAYISHDDWPHIVTWRTVEGAGVRLGLEMPLRRAIGSGETVDLYAHGLFKATSDDMGRFDTALGAGSSVVIDVVEWINR